VPQPFTTNRTHRGGDSKVDSETYPVADAVSLLWYEGVGREAASERWAFAISAKQKWRDKVRPDVKSIVGTQRGYALIYLSVANISKIKTEPALRMN
jgi:hypothetical protein